MQKDAKQGKKTSKKGKKNKNKKWARLQTL